MVQTQASAAGTLSAVIFIVPGLVMVGHWHGFPFWETAGVCAAGGILGVVYTVPLRRAMVVQSDLAYPEGVAAAEILRVGSGERAEAAPGERAEPGAARHPPGRRDRGRVQLPLGRPEGPGGRDQRLVRARRRRVPRRHRLLAGPPRGRLPGRHRGRDRDAGRGRDRLGGRRAAAHGGRHRPARRHDRQVRDRRLEPPGPLRRCRHDRHRRGLDAARPARADGRGCAGLLRRRAPARRGRRRGCAAHRARHAGRLARPDRGPAARRAGRDLRPLPEPDRGTAGTRHLLGPGGAGRRVRLRLRLPDRRRLRLHGGPGRLLGEPDLRHRHPGRRAGLAAAARGPGQRRRARHPGRRQARDRGRALHHLGDRRHRLDLERQPPGPQDRLPRGRHALAAAGGADRGLRRRGGRHPADPGPALLGLRLPRRPAPPGHGPRPGAGGTPGHADVGDRDRHLHPQARLVDDPDRDRASASS